MAVYSLIIGAQVGASNLASFTTFWWNLFSLVSSHTFNEAIFQVYLSKGQRLLSSSAAVHSMPQLCNQINKQFEGFHARTRMSTGLSMEIIWSICHPPIVPTMKRLEDIWQLERVADTFDNLIWMMKAPIGNLLILQRSMVETLDLARQQDTDVHTLIKVSWTTVSSD